MKKLIFLFVLSVSTVLAVSAQRRWELGVGGSVMQFNRVKFSNMTDTSFDLGLRHAVWGAHLYAARELSNVFALDLQGVVGRADERWLGQLGLGLQWRLGWYLHSRQVDPFLRVGANYMYKGFDIYYADSRDGLSWQMANRLNKEGRDERHLFTVAAGAGVNMWLTEGFGIGLQADYLFVPAPSVANSLRGTARLMWRFPRRAEGGGATVPVPVPAVLRDTVYVERTRVERDVVYGSLPTIYFDFDSAVVKPEYAGAIERMAAAMTEGNWLLTGYADAHGTAAYDERLSEQRAAAVRKALLDAGVPAARLKAVGGGKRVSRASEQETDHTREGDRRVTLERITNEDYWNIL